MQQADFILGVRDQEGEWGALFAPLQQVSRLCDGGADYIENFITINEEIRLLTAVDGEQWKNNLRRRVQHYGYRYDYTERNINADDRLGELPAWVKAISAQLVEKNIFMSPPDQLIVNEYQPGQGIAPHTDRDCFGPVVASLSLGGDCIMRIMPQRDTEQDAFEIVLKSRSLLVLQGASREVWRHGIASRKNDTQDGRKIPRRRRVSLTFRSVKS